MNLAGTDVYLEVTPIQEQAAMVPRIFLLVAMVFLGKRFASGPAPAPSMHHELDARLIERVVPEHVKAEIADLRARHSIEATFGAAMPIEKRLALKAQFPVGSAQYRRMVEGRRGLSVIGEPVYKGYFRRELHVREVTALKDVALIRSWDFGHRHPAVSWWQFTPWGGLQCLHEVMGDAQFIDDFAPLVCTVTQTLFPDCFHASLAFVFPRAHPNHTERTETSPGAGCLIFAALVYC